MGKVTWVGTHFQPVISYRNVQPVVSLFSRLFEINDYCTLWNGVSSVFDNPCTIQVPVSGAYSPKPLIPLNLAEIAKQAVLEAEQHCIWDDLVFKRSKDYTPSGASCFAAYGGIPRLFFEADGSSKPHVPWRVTLCDPRGDLLRDRFITHEVDLSPKGFSENHVTLEVSGGGDINALYGGICKHYREQGFNPKRDVLEPGIRF